MGILVKFDCDCIGFAPANEAEAERAWIIRVCDATEGNSYGFGTRNMQGKTFAALPAETCAVHLKNIDRLIGNGYSYRDLLLLLSPRPARLHDDRA